MKIWLLLNQNLHHFQYTSPLMDNKFSQFNPVYIAQPFLKIHFNPASASYTANLSHVTLFFNPKFTYPTHFSHLMVNGTTHWVSLFSLHLIAKVCKYCKEILMFSYLGIKFWPQFSNPSCSQYVLLYELTSCLLCLPCFLGSQFVYTYP